MRSLVQVLCVSMCGIAAIGTLSGCGKDEGSGPATDFEASVPIAISGQSPFAECELFDPGAEGANREVEPWMAVDPNDRDHLVSAWLQDKALGFGTAVSFDGGASWDNGVIPGISGCTGGDLALSSDPWLAFAINGDLYSVALTGPLPDLGTKSRIVVNKSLDGGLTWGDPVTISEVEEPPSDDKPSITADPVDECRVYVVWTRFADETTATSGNVGEVFFSRTTDCGATWSAPLSLYLDEPSGQWSQIVVMPDGALVAFFRQAAAILAVPREFYVMRSTDGGATWPSAPTLLATTRSVVPRTPDGEQPIRSGSFDVAVDRSTGHLAAVWEGILEEDIFAETQILFSQSLDGGLSWTDPVRIDQTPESAAEVLNQAFNPSVEISDDGTIGVTYYNFENDTPGTAPSETDYWFMHCHPSLMDCTSRVSWAEPVAVTQEPFDLLEAGYASQGYFLGDYMGLTSLGSDFFASFVIAGPGEEQDVYFSTITGR